MPGPVVGGKKFVASDVAKQPQAGVLVTVAASLLLVAANENRVCVYITNDSANVVYLSLGGVAVAGQGIRLNANGGSVTIAEYTGQINARAATADSQVGFCEV